MDDVDSKPKVARSANALGVRFASKPTDDICCDLEGCVAPNAGGMSVSATLDLLPPHRLPRRLAKKFPNRFGDADGSNNLYCWSWGDGVFEASRLLEGLQFRPDPQSPAVHGFIEPCNRQLLMEYEECLAKSRNHWQRWNEE
jgi:hypothetical protein